MRPVAVTRTKHRILPDPRRVLAKPYSPGEEIILAGESRAGVLMGRVLAIADSEVNVLLEQVLTTFSHRHRDFVGILENHFQLVAHHVNNLLAVGIAHGDAANFPPGWNNPSHG